MNPLDRRFFESPDEAKRFAERVAQKRPTVQKLIPDAIKEVDQSLDGASIELLFGRAGKRQNLTRLEPPGNGPHPGPAPAQWATTHYQNKQGIHIRGIRMPIPLLVARFGRELASPVDNFHWSLFALPAGSRVSNIREDGEVFLFHVRGGTVLGKTKKNNYELAPQTLTYVPSGTNFEISSRDEALLLRVRILFEPPWKVMLYTLAHNFSEDPALNGPAMGLLGEGEGAIAQRERLTAILDAAKSQLESWDAKAIVRDYKAITDRYTEPPAEPPPTDEEAEKAAIATTPMPVDDDSGGYMFPNAQWGILGVARRPDDIHVGPFKRSGTTWMQMIMYQLTTDGDMDKLEHMYQFSPYPEYELRILGTSKRIDELPSPRIIKSHLPFDHIYSPMGKYIYVARNGMDVAVSSFHHHRSVGNAPVPFDVYIDDFLGAARWFREVASWWSKRELPNVLFLTFGELKKDLAGTVTKIAKFCEIDLPPEKLARVVERAGFKTMKQWEDKFHHARGIEWLMRQEGASGEMIREGGVAKGKDQFNELQKKRFKDLYQRILGHTNLGLDE